MFNSNVLEVGFGLVFTFLAVSLITGAIIETITSLVGWRANTLLNGIKALLNDPNFTGLARDLYNHASINPRGPGATAALAGGGLGPNPRTIDRIRVAARHIAEVKEKPSYIEKAQFANALMDILGMSAAIGASSPATTPPSTTALTTAVAGKLGTAATTVAPTANPQIAQLVQGIIERNIGDPVKIKTDLESWFDTSMDRLSGVYKRWTQLLGFFIALALAIVLNIDSITIAKAVWRQPTLADNLKLSSSGSGSTTADREKLATESLKLLDKYLPIGWQHGFMQTSQPQLDANKEPKKDKDGKVLYAVVPFDWGDFWVAFLGWLITAIATLFGAPFWFDALQKITRLKGSGPSPGEKRTERAAAQ